MTSKCQRFLIFFYNFLLATSVKFENGRFKAAKLIAVKNFLFFPFLHFFLNNSIPQSFFEVSQRKISHNHGTITVFYYVIFYFLMLQNRISACICVYGHLMNQKKVLHFLNSCETFYEKRKLDFNFKCLKRRLFKILACSFSTLFTCFVVEFIAIFNPNWRGLLNSFLFHIHAVAVYTYYSFMSLFLNFFLFVFESFSKKLDNSIKNNFKTNFCELSQQYHETKRLLDEFSRTHGGIFSVLIFLTMSTMTIKVIFVDETFIKALKFLLL